jgi:hypothetical protein
MKKLIKKIKKWLIRKLGAYTPEEVYSQNFALTASKPHAECLSLNLAISNDAMLFKSEAGLDLVKLKVKDAICNFAINELPKYMSFVIEFSPPRGLSFVIKCGLNVIPVMQGSLADFLNSEAVYAPDLTTVPKNFGICKTWDEVWAELKEKYPEAIAEAERIKEEMEKEEEKKRKKRRQRNGSNDFNSPEMV